MAKKTKSSTSSETRLAQPLRGAAKLGLAGATDLYQDPAMQGLPSAYVPMDPTRTAGLSAIQGIAEGGSAVPEAALAEYNKILGGDYLAADANPYLEDIVGRSVGAGLRNLKGSFAGAGRYGSGAFANSAMDAASETASRLYGAQYEQERGRMMQALGMAPQMNELQYADPRVMEYVGRQREMDQAGQQNEQIRQFLWPYQQQAIYEASLSGSPLRQEGNADQTTVNTTPFDWGAMVTGLMNPLGSLLGGAAK